jgi:hypothetical protein
MFYLYYRFIGDAHFPDSNFLLSTCQGGVQRVHIIDGTVGGSLLLELFTRDGAGTLIARYTETLVALYLT